MELLPAGVRVPPGPPRPPAPPTTGWGSGPSGRPDNPQPRRMSPWGRLLTFGHEIALEMRQVTWSRRIAWLPNAMRILLSLALVAAVIGGLDLGFGRAIDHLIHAK